MESRPARIATPARQPGSLGGGQSVAGGEKTKEQLEEDLRKTREELDVQKWGIEKTLEGMKLLVKELTQKGKEVKEAKAKDEALAKELANRVTELERLNKYMVGRELKMIELKKEIEELKKSR